MIADRFYQAIIDRVTETDIEFEEAAQACGFDPDELLECFNAKPNSRPLNIYDYLGRKQIEQTAEFLHCPRLRILLLADVFKLADLRALGEMLVGPSQVSNTGAMKTLVSRVAGDDASAGELQELADAAIAGGLDARRQALEALVQFFGDVTRSRFAGHPEVIIDEMIAATFSESLTEACQKVGLEESLVQRWLTGEPATLANLEALRTVARTIGLPMSPVLIATKVIIPSDLLWNGLPVDIMAELERALDVDVW